MKILILSRNVSLYSTQRLIIEARKKGLYVTINDPLDLSLFIENNAHVLLDEFGQKVTADAVIPRIGNTITNFGAAVIRQFQLQGVPVTTDANALMQARDKLIAFQKLAAYDIPLPKTCLPSPLNISKNLIKSQFDFPLIIKLLESTHGLGVILSENESNATAIAEAFQTTEQKYILQQFISDSAGKDIRAFVVNGRVVAAMQRSAIAGEFRSNMHRGAEANPVVLTPFEKELVLKACKILDLKVAGVDFMRSKSGPMILEVNASPGLEGIENTTKINVAGIIIDYALQLIRRSQIKKLKKID